MAARELTYSVGVDASDAVSGLRKLDSAFKSTMRGVESELDEGATAGDKFSASIDKLTAGMKEDFNSAAIAAEELQRALKDAGSGLNVADVLPQLQRMGFSFDEITQSADKFATSLKQLDDVQATGVRDLDSVAPGLASKLDNVSRSADSSKGALANMIGNSAQDLGELGGISGSTGVAIGQMAEYFADAAFEGEGLRSVIGNFAAVAGPILAITAAVSAVTGAMAAQQKRAEESAARTEEFGDAMASAADDSVGLSASLRESEGALREFDASTALLGDFGSIINDAGKAIPLLGALFADTSVDIVDALSDAGLSIYQFANAIEGGSGTREAFKQDLRDFFDAGMLTSDQYKALSQSVNQYGEEVDKARQAQKLANVSTEEANALLQETITQGAPLERYGEQWRTLFSDIADGSVDTEAAANAINFLAEKLGLTQQEVVELAQEDLAQQLDEQAEAADAAAAAQQELSSAVQDYVGVVRSADFQRSDLEGGIAGMQAFTSELNALPEIASNAEAAFAELKTSVDEVGFTFDLTTEAGRKNQNALLGVAESLDTKLAAAYAEANGNQQAFADEAGRIADETLTRLASELGLSAEQTAELAARLGLLPQDLETRYELSGEAEAAAKLAQLQGLIGSLPPEIQFQVGAMIAEGNIEGAVALIQTSFADLTAQVTLGADPKPAVEQISDVTSGDYLVNMGVEADTPPAQDAIEDVADADYEAVVVAEPDIARADAALATLARDRRLRIIAEADTASANGELATTARDRRVVIFATASTGSADAALDALTRQRTVTIVPRVAPTTVLVRVDGGG